MSYENALISIVKLDDNSSEYWILALMNNHFLQWSQYKQNPTIIIFNDLFVFFYPYNN